MSGEALYSRIVQPAPIPQSHFRQVYSDQAAPILQNNYRHVYNDPTAFAPQHNFRQVYNEPARPFYQPATSPVDHQKYVGSLSSDVSSVHYSSNGLSYNF